MKYKLFFVPIGLCDVCHGKHTENVCLNGSGKQVKIDM